MESSNAASKLQSVVSQHKELKKTKTVIDLLGMLHPAVKLESLCDYCGFGMKFYFCASFKYLKELELGSADASRSFRIL